MVCCCKKNMNKILINDEVFFECPSCGLLLKEAILSPIDEKHRYDLHICDEGYLKYMHGVFNKIKTYIYGEKILDFGCGQIHALSDILNDNGFCSDYYDLYYYPEIKNNKYDTIILIEVFEHLSNPYEQLLNIKNLLNQFGRLIIMTKPYDDVKDLNKWWYLRDKTHISFIKRETMNKWNIPFKVLFISDDIFVLESI